MTILSGKSFPNLNSYLPFAYFLKNIYFRNFSRYRYRNNDVPMKKRPKLRNANKGKNNKIKFKIRNTINLKI